MKIKKHMPKKIGDSITCDHVDSRNGPSMNGNVFLLDIMDLATKFMGAYPVKGKSAQESFVCMAHFIGNDKAKVLYADRAGEFNWVANKCGLTYVGSTPDIKGSNGKIERNNRYIEDMTRSVLIAAGLPPFFWEFAAQHAAMMSNLKMDYELGISP